MRLYKYVGASRKHRGRVYVRVPPSDPSRIPVRQKMTTIREACFRIGVPKALFHIHDADGTRMVSFALDEMEELSDEEASAILVLDS